MEPYIDLARGLGTVFLVVFYGSLVLWTYKDARRRIDDPILIGTAVIASMVLPIVGVFVYMLLRPPEYLEDVHERKLEILAREQELSRIHRCPSCKWVVDHDYRACPSCGTHLRDECSDCSRTLDPRWRVCPYCETPVRGGGSPRRPEPKSWSASDDDAADTPRSARASSSAKSTAKPDAADAVPASATTRSATAFVTDDDLDVDAEALAPPVKSGGRKTKR